MKGQVMQTHETVGTGYSATHSGDVVTLTDPTGARAVIRVAEGNNVARFQVHVAGGDQLIDVLVPPDEANGGYSYGNPILFPFPNRVKGGTYTFAGVQHQLDVNETARGNHIHGLVNRRPWRVDGVGVDEMRGAWQISTFDLRADADVQRQYPFGAVISVTTSLHGGHLTQHTIVTNHGTGAMPMGYGIHPWFPVTMGPSPREATQVCVPGASIWELDNLVPTGKRIPVQGNDLDLRGWPEIATRELDHVYTDVERRADGWTEAGVIYPDSGLRLLVEASPEFREWVIFAPPFRPVVCLEPYSGTTNAVNLHFEGVDAGLVILEPGQVWDATVRFSLAPR